jgi:hypothetical protein
MLFIRQAGICRYFSEFIVIIGIFRQISLIKYFGGLMYTRGFIRPRLDAEPEASFKNKGAGVL